MPTINKYENDEGYYIRAWTSDAGNITYKIRNEGRPVVWKHGLRDGDEIAWSTIQSFKALGIIYTDESGTLGPGDFEPDPEQFAETELTDSDARELFDIITSEFELSAAERAEIREILGLPAELDLTSTADRLESYLETHVEREGLSIRPDRVATNSDAVTISAWANSSNGREVDRQELHILVMSESETGDETWFTDHCIHLCDEHGLEHWHVRILQEPTWDIKRVAIQQQAVLFPRLLDELRATEFDLGDPSEMLDPVIEVAESGIDA